MARGKSAGIPAGARAVPPQGGQFIATPVNDVTIPFFSNVLEPQDPTIREKGAAKGLKLYDEVLRDGRVRTVLGKRFTKVTRRSWTVTPADPDKPLDLEIAEAITRMLKRIGFDGISKHLLKAILKGYAVAEVIWHLDQDGLIAPKAIKAHDQARFRFAPDWRPRLLTRESGFEGIELPERKFIVHRYDAEGNNPYGLGLGSTLFWHVLFKREGVASWMVLLEKFAAPTPFGRFPAGTAASEQDRLLLLLRDLVSNGALAAPIGTEVEFLEAKRSGDAGYEAWVRYWDEQTSEVVLGSTLSTSVKGEGARAASETHADETEAIIDDDADALSETFNDTLIRWITELNWPGATPPSVWRPRPSNEKDEEALKKSRHERQRGAVGLLNELRRQGFEPDDVEAWLADVMETPVTGFSRQDLAASPAADALTTAFADAAAAREGDPTSHLVDQVADLAGPALTGWIGTLRETLSGVKDYSHASQALLEAYGRLQPDPLGNILGDALALAELNGRADVQDETGVLPSFTAAGKGSKKNF